MGGGGTALQKALGARPTSGGTRLKKSVWPWLQSLVVKEEFETVFEIAGGV